MPNKLAAQWLPPVLRRAVNRAVGADIVYRGPFGDWHAATSATAGYDQGAILERVSRATRHVLEGAATFEQDGVESTENPPPSHALAGLMLAAGLEDGRLSVLDFGGGLASHFLRWRPMLAALPGVRWMVVEQANFVAEGRVLFAGEAAVSFHEAIGQVAVRPNVVLASGVLQYLPEPHAMLQRLLATQPRVVVLDRLPYGADGNETIVTQFVPAHMGKASYPLWVLSRERVHAAMSVDYTCVMDFATADHPLSAPGVHADYRGSIWVRRT